MVEQENDDILISKVRYISSSSSSQNDKLIAALQVAIIVGFIHAHFAIRLTSRLVQYLVRVLNFSTKESESREMYNGQLRSSWSQNSNLSEKRHKVLMHKSRLIQVRNFYQKDRKLKF